MSKIEKLTKEQEAYLPVFRKEYFDIATSSKRIDRAKLESAIEDTYAVVGKKKPILIILQSPQQAMMAVKFMEVYAKAETGDQLGDQLRGQLRDQLGGQLWDQLWGQLGGQLWGQLGGQLGDQLRGQLRDQLGGQLWDQLRGQLGDQLWDQLGDQLRGQLRGQKIWNDNFLWGSQDLHWIAWAKFAEYIGVKLKGETKHRVEIMHRIGSQCEWWWPYEGFCFVSEKPNYIKWDDNKRLHAETGPAIEYEDGYSLYAWHGTRVPEAWIKDKSSITPDVALKWENTEQRRCAMEIVGWNNILKEIGARSVDKDEDPQIGELLEVSHPSIGNKEKFLKVQCATGRTFALPVPPKMKTALEANAFTYGLDGNALKKLKIRT